MELIFNETNLIEYSVFYNQVLEGTLDNIPYYIYFKLMLYDDYVSHRFHSDLTAFGIKHGYPHETSYEIQIKNKSIILDRYRHFDSKYTMEMIYKFIRKDLKIISNSGYVVIEYKYLDLIYTFKISKKLIY